MALLSDLRKKSVFSPSNIECGRVITVENRAATRFFDIQEEIDRENGVERPEGGVIFEPLAGSPYFMPINRKAYHPESRFGPLGTCPLCNNARHAEFDAALARKVGSVPPEGMFGFARALVIEHIACHMGPVYASAGLRACKVAGVPLKDVKGDVGRAVRAALAEESGPDDAGVQVLVLEPGERSWYDGPKAGGDRGRPDPSPRRERSGANGIYAYDGNSPAGALKPWEDDRVETELAKRKDEAIVFYDEMLDARRMARQIYADIMDSDIDALNAEREGEKGGKYVERNYSAAIAAVREIRSIATDMAKLALIATKYSDGKEAKRVLSPVMQGMIDEIGVFDAGEESLGEPDEPIEEDDAEVID